MTIDRTFLPRRPLPAMTTWPDWETAGMREMCAPLSASLDSPRGNRHDGAGLAFANARHIANVERRRLAKLKPKDRGKYA